MFTIMRVLVLIISVLLCWCNAQTIECEEMTIVVTDTQEEIIMMSWTPNSCAQQYMVKHYVNGEIDFNDMIVHPLTFVPLNRHSCSHNRVTISLGKVEDAGDFTEASKEFLLGLAGDSKVRDLQFNEELGRFEWSPPEGAEECKLVYEVDFRNELTNDKLTAADEFFEFPLHFCSNNWISVTTIIDVQGEAIVGDYVIGTHIEGRPDVLEVQNLGFDSDQSRFLWQAPVKSELCEVEYEVSFDSDITSTKSTITNEFYQISVYPCTINEIAITTVIGFDGSRSNEVSDTYQGPVTRQLPVHISTNPHEDGATVTWRIDTESNNFCRINELVYAVENVNDFVEPFQGYGLREFVISSLSTGTVHRYRLCYSFQLPFLDMVCSDYISFLTQPLLTPTISLQTTDDRQILISWEHNYHSDFVTGQSIFIEPIGPNHFVPSQCPIDKNVIVKDVDPVATSYYFDANPSFVYEIQVEIQFGGLGIVTTSDKETIITNEYTPGDLDVQSSYEFVPSVVYSVLLTVNWIIPCDINGNVISFEYTIWGAPNFEGECGDFTLGSGTVDGSEGSDGVYSITNPNVLPFFKYSITITTSLQVHQATIERNLKDPPQPFTPYS